jgi:hypothetical protein
VLERFASIHEPARASRGALVGALAASGLIALLVLGARLIVTAAPAPKRAASFADDAPLSSLPESPGAASELVASASADAPASTPPPVPEGTGLETDVPSVELPIGVQFTLTFGNSESAPPAPAAEVRSEPIETPTGAFEEAESSAFGAPGRG